MTKPTTFRTSVAHDTDEGLVIETRQDISGILEANLAERNLINDSLQNSVNKYGYARLEDLIVTWLDKDYYKITN